MFEHLEHIDAWNRAADGQPVNREELFHGYRSAVDWPVCASYRKLADRYPETKLILTLRDPERWYRSAMETIFPIMAGSPPEGQPVARAQARMAARIILERTFGGRVDDREHAIAVLIRCGEEVKRAIPPERLLVCEVAEGSEPLCRLLGRPVPAVCFPRVNTIDEFRPMLAARRGARSRQHDAERRRVMAASRRPRRPIPGTGRLAELQGYGGKRDPAGGAGAQPREAATMDRTSKPPFRADHVGSLLRPQHLLDARERRARRELSAEALGEVEDEAIRRIVRRQEEVGLRGITDGEFRRTYFHVDFLEQLDGVSVGESGFTATFRRDDGTEVGFKPPTMHVTAPIRHRHPIQGRDFEFLAAVTTRTPKVSIPSPSMLHFRGGRQAISESVYPELDAFYADLAAAYRAEIEDLAGRGCRYLQMDDTNLAYLCDDRIREATRARGDDPNELPRLYCRLINEAVAGRPDDMAVCVHLCRGNYRSAWVAQGGYEPVAEILFDELAIDGFFLEYDDPRSGDFSPLRFVPKGKTVVLGVMSSKRAELEGKEQLKRRIEEASRYVPLDQLALSPQCGFASTVHGNLLTEDDQWRKLECAVEVAREVWGEV